jgi:uncharacterized protein (TIGR02453 family)
MEHPPFTGIRKQGFDFLRQLAENNSRDWFKPRKSVFDEELKWPLECLVVDASREFGSRKIPLYGDPKKSLFRIHRDTRFSKDKSPYKTHVSAVLSPGGGRNEPGGVYIHLEPRNCLLAAGYWQPDPKLLRAFRNEMVNNPDEFMAMAKRLKRKGLPLDQHGEGLKRLPKGFDVQEDDPIAPYLKWKSFIVVKNLKQQDAASRELTKQVVKFGVDVLPFLEYGWRLG